MISLDDDDALRQPHGTPLQHGEGLFIRWIARVLTLGIKTSYFVPSVAMRKPLSPYLTTHLSIEGVSEGRPDRRWHSSASPRDGGSRGTLKGIIGDEAYSRHP